MVARARQRATWADIAELEVDAESRGKNLEASSDHVTVKARVPIETSCS